MKLEITPEWLTSFDDKTLEPSGYATPRERAAVARRRENIQEAKGSEEQSAVTG